MARPLKINADYFSHDNNMRNNRKLLALRAKFGLIGYAIWCMFVETLTESDYFKIELDEQEMLILSGDYQIEVEKLKEILDYCVQLRLIQKENDTYWSDNHLERMNGVMRYRERKRGYGQVMDGNNEVMDGNKPVIPVMKVKRKESKEKVNILSRFTPPTFEEVSDYCKERNNLVDAQRFIDFYTAKGWMVGKNKMKDWKAAVRTWEKSNNTTSSSDVDYLKELKERYANR